ncbi:MULTISPECIES: bifunctional metallophosphatase/5'-nucleotidase [Fusobacterium]|jgi:5'-nucleotidase/UDP-sugar diphosphatase|uniref:bifunctional metallophosphatase/5'-nucleotidase n=1 Tax=Fusobacterium TaxID=848 RepID=UPI000E852891|nr:MULTISPECIES: bifunctional UDP-sugar hydrolase/5'-nucleotidase [Fusobacterium]HBJ78015.1 bifunctional metallophosphatase/5'-nucleotidase [Fusobacterium sp.]
MKLKKLVFSFITIIFLLAGCSNIQSNPNNKYELVVIHLNDVHGRAEEGKYDGMGYPKVASIINKYREVFGKENVLYLDAGDNIHGTTFATLEKGESMINLSNEMGLDAIALGNHDFNYGMEQLLKLENMADFKFLTTNVLTKDGNPIGTKYIIRKIRGVKVGIFGLTTPETVYKANPQIVKNLIFADPIDTAKKTTEELRKKGVQFIIAVTHLGDDPSTKYEWQSVGLAESVPEINLIIDGHSHTVLKNKTVVNGVTIVQTGEYDKNIGIVKIDFDELAYGEKSIYPILLSKDEVNSGKDLSVKMELNEKFIVKEDKKIAELISNIKAQQQKIISEKIGKTPVVLEASREKVRTSETNLGNLVTDAILEKSQADIAITSGGSIRSSIGIGDITIENIISVLPFGNYVVVKELTGKQIWNMFENGFSKYPETDGRFPQFSGATVTFNPKKPAGKRVENITLKNGTPLDLNKTYKVASDDYIAVGGDEYNMFINAKEVANYPALTEIVIENIKKNGVTNLTTDNRLIKK